MNRQRDRNVSAKAWCSGLAGLDVESYRLDQFIGAGKIGFVYKAHHRDFPEIPRAVKLVFGELKQGWDTELKKVMKLELVNGVVHYHSHSNAQLTHNNETKMCFYTVWDFISPGENLRDYLNRVEVVSVSIVLAVVERILHVLHNCHLKGVVRHGDLHAGNILIGSEDMATIDDSLVPRLPIFVSDFGYGATGGQISLKDDYKGLGEIVNEMVARVNYATATATHRQILHAIKPLFSKILLESNGPERRSPYELLRIIAEIKSRAQGGIPDHASTDQGTVESEQVRAIQGDGSAVGQFQVSEMIGDRWNWWKTLFVPTVPARSKILALDIPTVVTGPRGCGKTMLFRRLSERLMIECGPIDGLPSPFKFLAFYVNANDIADAFSHFPENPDAGEESRLICYANLCVLSEVLSVQSAISAQSKNADSASALLGLVQRLLTSESSDSLIVGENRLDRYRAILEQIKWKFPTGDHSLTFPGYSSLSQHRWLPMFTQQVRECCGWVGNRSILLFVDDYSTPRVSPSMQRVLNRLFLQRSHEFLAKVATEAWTTFFPQDSSGKNLQDGDDFQMVDMGEESLFLPDAERLEFLNAVFSRRLSIDQRMPAIEYGLRGLLGRMGLSKTEFARRLRVSKADHETTEIPEIDGSSQRRGRSRARVNYFGDDVFANLWSGDTRNMIQLIADLVDQAHDAAQGGYKLSIPLGEGLQDRVFRNRGGEWLNSHTRNEPTNPARYRNELSRLRKQRPEYKLCGEYGDHLKAIVEAFVAAASALLRGPTYGILDKTTGKRRFVPRMAFRLEIVDEFRIDGLAQEIYRDLIRYGLFMRDNRGKSVRGAFVPRLYLRRLLLPYCTLALSKRDSVPLTCASFIQLLLEPDVFKQNFIVSKNRDVAAGQMTMFEDSQGVEIDPIYDDGDDFLDKQVVPSVTK